MDIRSRQDSIRLAVVESVTKGIHELCDRRGVRCEVDLKHEAPATPCDGSIIAGLVRAADDSRLVMQRVLQQQPPAASAAAIAVSHSGALYHMLDLNTFTCACACD